MGGQPLLPLGRVVPYQVVDLPRKPLLGFERRVGVGPQEVEGQRVAISLAVGEGEHRPLSGEVEAVACTLSVVAHRLLGLALVGDKGERELRVGV
jgi:hypothetical protein